MRASWSLWILVAVVTCSIVASSGGQSPADRPDGVDVDRWVSISDSAGIVLTEPIVGVPVPGTDRLEIVPALRPRTGVLMVNAQDRWMRVDLELPAARAHPLH
jgi:hypothetical protein